MNPPVAWTYPSTTAVSDQSFFPGQSLTQLDAQNQANGDITAAVFEGLSTIGVSTLGVKVVPNFTPPLINDCIKSTTSQQQTSIGVAFGIVEQGIRVYKIS